MVVSIQIFRLPDPQFVSRQPNTAGGRKSNLRNNGPQLLNFGGGNHDSRNAAV